LINPGTNINQSERAVGVTIEVVIPTVIGIQKKEVRRIKVKGKENNAIVGARGL